MKRSIRSISVILILALVMTCALSGLSVITDGGSAYAASLSKPKISTRTADNKITVSWKKISGAAKYQVAYKIKGADSWTYKYTTNLKYTIKGKYNKTYRIKVRAVKGSSRSSWSRITERKTEKMQVPTTKKVNLAKPSTLKNYRSFKIGKTYTLKDPMGTGRTRKVKISYGDIICLTGSKVSLGIMGVTKKGFDYVAVVSGGDITYIYGNDPLGLLPSGSDNGLPEGSGSDSDVPSLKELLDGADVDEIIGSIELPDITAPEVPDDPAPDFPSGIEIPDPLTVVWTIDNAQPTRTQKDKIDKTGKKVRGTVTNITEFMALSQLRAVKGQPVWIKIYQGKTLVYERYTKAG